MRRALFLALLLAVLTLPACQSNRIAARPKRPKLYRSIVSLSPSTSEILMTFGSGSLLKGRTAADNWPEHIKSVEVVASVKPNYERLAQLKPELVVYDAALYSQADLDKVKQVTGATMFGISAKTLQDFYEQLFDLASLIATETRTNEYVNKMIAETGWANAEPFNPIPKVAVMLPGSAGRDYIAGTDSFVASVVKAAGGEPIGPPVDKFDPVSPEALVGMNPDVILLGGNKQDVKSILGVLQNPKYQSLKAIKTKRVKVINEDILVRRGARVDLLIHAVHTAIAPEAGS